MYHLAWEVDTLDELERIAGVLAQRGSLVGASDHGTTKALYAKDPDGIEFEVSWLVPADLLDEVVLAARRQHRPLDIAREKQRYGADHPRRRRRFHSRTGLIAEEGGMRPSSAMKRPQLRRRGGREVHMEQYTSEGLVFDVTDAGPADGEVIILLHGYPETRASWQSVIPHLTDAGYRVLAPDQRGYSPGARPQGRRAYRLDHLVGDVVVLAEAAGAERVHVVGHDWGGLVAWALAGWHPDRLFSMASLATPHPRAMLRSFFTSSQALHSWYMAFYQLPKLPEMGFRGRLEPRFRQTLARSGLPEDSIDQYLSVLHQPGAATAAINWYRAIPFTPPSELVAVDVPALYLYGAGDFALSRKAADLTERYVKGPYNYQVLAGASHWLPEACPDVVAREVIAHAGEFGLTGGRGAGAGAGG